MTDSVVTGPGRELPGRGLEAQRLLVFPGRTEIGLKIRAALAHRRDIELFSAGVSGPGHAPYVFRNHDEVPDVRGPGWEEPLARVVRKRRIDVVFPAHDDAVLGVAEHAATIGAIDVGSPLETCRVTRSKWTTYRALAGAVPVPLVYNEPAEIADFPVFVKPDRV